jgi:hypothetical protein
MSTVQGRVFGLDNLAIELADHESGERTEMEVEGAEDEDKLEGSRTSLRAMFLARSSNQPNFDLLVAVRDPIGRLVSSYRYIRREPRDRLHRASISKPLSSTRFR